MTNEQINTIMTMVVVPILVAVSSYVVNYLRLKSKELQNKIDDDYINKLLLRAEDIVASVVTEVTQTFVTEMKKSNQWDSSTALQALNMAKQKAINILGEETLNALKHSYLDIEAWLTTKIEFYVNVNKK